MNARSSSTRPMPSEVPPSGVPIASSISSREVTRRNAKNPIGSMPRITPERRACAVRARTSRCAARRSRRVPRDRRERSGGRHRSGDGGRGRRRSGAHPRTVRVRPRRQAPPRSVCRSRSRRRGRELASERLLRLVPRVGERLWKRQPGAEPGAKALTASAICSTARCRRPDRRCRCIEVRGRAHHPSRRPDQGAHQTSPPRADGRARPIGERRRARRVARSQADGRSIGPGIAMARSAKKPANARRPAATRSSVRPASNSQSPTSSPRSARMSATPGRPRWPRSLLRRRHAHGTGTTATRRALLDGCLRPPRSPTRRAGRLGAAPAAPPHRSRRRPDFGCGRPAARHPTSSPSSPAATAGAGTSSRARSRATRRAPCSSPAACREPHRPGPRRR